MCSPHSQKCRSEVCKLQQVEPFFFIYIYILLRIYRKVTLLKIPDHLHGVSIFSIITRCYLGDRQEKKKLFHSHLKKKICFYVFPDCTQSIVFTSQWVNVHPLNVCYHALREHKKTMKTHRLHRNVRFQVAKLKILQSGKMF